MINEQLILKALSTVIDPDLKKDLVSLGMIKNLEIRENKVKFVLELTTPACPLKNYLKESCINAIKTLVSEDIEVELEFGSKVSRGAKNNFDENSLISGVKNIIAVVSGKGGVGKSTISANLAAGLAKQGAKVGILDADIYGPSIPMMFGIEGQSPAVIEKDGRQIMEPILAYGVKVMSIGFFVSPDASLMWRGPMAANYLKQLILDTNWGDLDYLIFDMPPGTGDMHLTLVQTVSVSGSVVVSTPQEIALADARKAISMFADKNIDVPILGVVENMSYFIPNDAPDKKYYIFGKEGTKRLAEKHNLKLLGEIPIYAEICSSGDHGLPAVIGSNETLINSFDEFCSKTAQSLAIRNAELQPTKIVEIKS